MALLSHIFAADFFQSDSLSLKVVPSRSRECYNVHMTQQLSEAIEIIRELPDDEQDTIARQLIRIIDLAQTTSAELASASGDGLL
jgi:hypothetical protein